MSGLAERDNGIVRSSKRESEFVFSDRDFNFLRALVTEHAGIVMAESKRDLVYGRLVRRLRVLGIDRFSDYCELLKRDPEGELEEFLNALTTNLTSFFREMHHFDFLHATLLPQLIQSKSEPRLRIWSAGCSTGEEPYSIAMVLAEHVPADWDVRVLATDLDSKVLAQAQRGVYTLERVTGLPKSRLHRWFRKGRADKAGLVRVSPELQAMISFKQLNLMKEWPMRGRFDFIFCRNVVIYFDKPTQRRLFSRMADHLVDQGHLFLGHSESMFKVSDRYRLLGSTIYQKLS